MDINFKEFMELTRKATLYDIIINYARTKGVYVTKNDILEFIGECAPKEYEEEGTTNV